MTSWHRPGSSSAHYLAAKWRAKDEETRLLKMEKDTEKWNNLRAEEEITRQKYDKAALDYYIFDEEK